MRAIPRSHFRNHQSVLAFFLLLTAPLIGCDGGYASAQARPALRIAPTASPRVAEVNIGAGLRLQAPPKRKTQTRVIIGAVVGATAGWLIGRSQGDNFGTHGIILLAGFGALMGLAFTPRP